MKTLQFWRRPILQMFAAAILGASLVAGLDFLPSFAASAQQRGMQPFAIAARSAERVDSTLLATNGDALKEDIEKYMWKHVYMMGEVSAVIEIPSDSENNYLLRVSTNRRDHPSYDTNTWSGGYITLLYWDASPWFSVSKGDIIEFVATVAGFDVLGDDEQLFTLPLLEVVELQEMEFPGTVEQARE